MSDTVNEVSSVIEPSPMEDSAEAPTVELKPTWDPAPDLSELDNIAVPEAPCEAVPIPAAEVSVAKEEPAEEHAVETVISEEPVVTDAPAAVEAPPMAEPVSIAEPAIEEQPVPAPLVISGVELDKARHKSQEADEAVKAAKEIYLAKNAAADEARLAITEAQTALKAVLKAEKKRLRAWKKEARRHAADYLAAWGKADEVSRAQLNTNRKSAVKSWHKSLRSLDSQERKDQKKAYRAYKVRLCRTRRLIVWLIIAAVVAAAVLVTIFVPAINQLVTGWQNDIWQSFLQLFR